MKNQTKIFWSMTLCTKLLIDAKLLHITFGKVNGFIRDYDGTKYLVLFKLEKHDAIYDRVDLIGLKSDIIHAFFSNLCKNQNWLRC